MKDDEVLYATAEIDGETIEFYRSKDHENEHCIPKHYKDSDTNHLRKYIQEWSHIVIRKLEKFDYLFSDDLHLLKLYLPDLICEIIKRDFNRNVSFGWQDDDYIIFSDHLSRQDALNQFNKHFNRNAN